MHAADIAPLPEDASFFRRLWVGFRAFRHLVKDTADPVYGPLFQDSMDGGKYAMWARRLAADPQGRRLLEERPSLSIERFDFDRLGKLPAGTVGREIVRFYQDNQLRPFRSRQRSLTNAQYLAQRMREAHDLQHLLTGYGIDEVGEHEFQAFQYGNLKTPSSLLVVILALPKRYSVPRRTYVRRLWKAYRRGKSCPPMAGLWWEDLWETPLAQVTASYPAS